jgi:hypothetical protein
MWEEFITSVVSVISVIILVLIISLGVSKVDDRLWNNGQCSCGGKWEYVQPIGHAYSTYYLYECDACGKTKEFIKKR